MIGDCVDTGRQWLGSRQKMKEAEAAEEEECQSEWKPGMLTLSNSAQDQGHPDGKNANGNQDCPNPKQELEAANHGVAKRSGEAEESEQKDQSNHEQNQAPDVVSLTLEPLSHRAPDLRKSSAWPFRPF